MIGSLPKELEVNGKKWAIRSDFRDVLNILVAMDDVDLKEDEKWMIALSILYLEFSDMNPSDYEEAIEKAMWFLSMGEQRTQDIKDIRIYDWQKDEQMIFSAVNKVSGTEVRSVDYMHFWTFMGYFNEVGEGLLSMVAGIRMKKAKGKSLEPYEKEFYKENKDIVDIKKRSKEELEEIERINKILG